MFEFFFKKKIEKKHLFLRSYEPFFCLPPNLLLLSFSSERFHSFWSLFLQAMIDCLLTPFFSFLFFSFFFFLFSFFVVDLLQYSEHLCCSPRTPPTLLY